MWPELQLTFRMHTRHWHWKGISSGTREIIFFKLVLKFHISENIPNISGDAISISVLKNSDIGNTIQVSVRCCLLCLAVRSRMFGSHLGEFPWRAGGCYRIC